MNRGLLSVFGTGRDGCALTVLQTRCGDKFPPWLQCQEPTLNLDLLPGVLLKSYTRNHGIHKVTCYIYKIGINQKYLFLKDNFIERRRCNNLISANKPAAIFLYPSSKIQAAGQTWYPDGHKEALLTGTKRDRRCAGTWSPTAPPRQYRGGGKINPKAARK